MGGGAGISVHGSHRIMSERALFAMPETGIGLFPDVGATEFLARCPGALGMYLGLTGARIKAADAIHAGIGTHFMPSSALPEFARRLASADLSAGAAAVDALAAECRAPGPAPIREHRRVIDKCFAADGPAAIVAALEAEDGYFAIETADELRAKSPTSCWSPSASSGRGPGSAGARRCAANTGSPRACLEGHDFFEGIRAAVIDKDRSPRWDPARLERSRRRRWTPISPRAGASSTRLRRRRTRWPGSASSGSGTWAGRWRATWRRPATTCAATTSTPAPGPRRGTPGSPSRTARGRGRRRGRRHHHAAGGGDVRAAYTGGGGVLAHAAPGALLVDCSTIDVETARDVHREAAGRGFAHLDAPVSGGVGGAEAGTLTFMAGGGEAAFDRARPLLEAMGRNLFLAGGPGCGQAAKICNNMVLGVSMIAVSEAFVLAERVGLDARTLFDVMSAASGRCWALTSYCPVPGPVPSSPANRGYAAGFTAAMMSKDLGLARAAAGAAGAAAPLGAHAADLFARHCAESGGGGDFSGIVRMLRADAPGAGAIGQWDISVGTVRLRISDWVTPPNTHSRVREWP